MTKNIKLSIVVFSYNQEKYIKQTLDSIITQNHPYSWELIVCDDASQDSTPEIISEYAGKHPEIVPVLRNINLGLIKNFYDGISRCRGEYVMVCAGDDYWLPGKVAKQVEFMDKHPEVGLCYGDANKIYENGQQMGEWVGKEINTFESFLSGNYVCAPSITLSKKIMNRYIAEIKPYEKDWKMEDYPMILWFSKNSKIQYLSGKVVAYRVCVESASHSKCIGKLMGMLQSDYDVKKYFRDKYRAYDFNLEYQHLITLISYLSISDEKYKRLCLAQLEKCKLKNIQRWYYKLRIQSLLFNKIVCTLNSIQKKLL